MFDPDSHHLPDDFAEAAVLPPDHTLRVEMEDHARRTGGELWIAFQTACAESDSLRAATADVAVPSRLAAQLLTLPDNMAPHLSEASKPYETTLKLEGAKSAGPRFIF